MNLVNTDMTNLRLPKIYPPIKVENDVVTYDIPPRSGAIFCFPISSYVNS